MGRCGSARASGNSRSSQLTNSSWYTNASEQSGEAAKGAPFAASPDCSDAFVYQDEFVSWLEREFPEARADPQRPIFYSLDNEPDLWGSTHEEVRGDRLARDR